MQEIFIKNQVNRMVVKMVDDSIVVIKLTKEGFPGNTTCMSVQYTRW